MSEAIKKMLERKEARKKEIMEMTAKSEDIVEVRSLMNEMESVSADIEGLREELLSGVNITGERTEAVTTGGIPGMVMKGCVELRKEEDTEGVEYRKAFMDFILKKEEIPAEYRSSEKTTTADIQAVLPTNLINRILEKLETLGMIFPRVTKTSYPGGFEIPKANMKPKATWVAEGEGSDRQKQTIKDKLIFSYYKLRCEVAMTMESHVIALSAFEDKFVRDCANAMSVAIEQAILTGTGSGQPKGILTETPLAKQLLPVDKLTYNTITDAEAALPQAYESGAVWCMTKGTFMGFLGMVDSSGQPIARINYGLEGKPDIALLGRSVILCGDYLPSYSAALNDDEIFAFIFDFSDYILNTTYNMGIMKKQDWDTEDHLIKAVMSIDGKCADVNSLVVLKKKKTV